MQVAKLQKKLAKSEQNKKVQQLRARKLKDAHVGSLAKKDIQLVKKNKIISETSHAVRKAREKV